MIKHAVQYVFHTMQVILVILMKRFMQNLLKRQSNEKKTRIVTLKNIAKM